MNILNVLIGSLFLFLISAGCLPVQSINPLYNDSDKVFDAKLIGVWKEKAVDAQWVFKRKGDKVYEVVSTNKESRMVELEARLVKLGEHLFLDTYVYSWWGSQPEHLLFHLMPIHIFSKIEIGEDTLRISPISMERIHTMVKHENIKISHAVFSDEDKWVVLTAQTPELRQFVEKHANEKDFYTDVIELRRQP